jgi:TPR repeat protein
MSKETAVSLMQRGQDSLKNGDIATARMLFGRLADAGIADAAFAAAETYDARYLAAHNVLGVPGDDAKARDYYQRAAQLGSTEASAHLAGAVAK